MRYAILKLKSASIFLTLSALVMFSLLQRSPLYEETWQNREEWTQYAFPKAGFVVSFPKGWRVVEQLFVSKEVPYTITFTADQPGVHGLVQVWNIPDLKEFIEQSILTAPAIDNVGFWPYTIHDLNGYFLSYRQWIQNDKIYIREVFLKNGGKTVYRIALMIPEKMISDEWDRIFEKILASFRPIH